MMYYRMWNAGKRANYNFSANTVNDDIVEIPHVNSGNSGNSENSRKYRN